MIPDEGLFNWKFYIKNGIQNFLIVDFRKNQIFYKSFSRNKYFSTNSEHLETFFNFILKKK
jgi:hypothetical protein